MDGSGSVSRVLDLFMVRLNQIWPYLEAKGEYLAVIVAILLVMMDIFVPHNLVLHNVVPQDTARAPALPQTKLCTAFIAQWRGSTTGVSVSCHLLDAMRTSLFAMLPGG